MLLTHLAGTAPPGGVPAEVVRLAEQAGVLDILGSVSLGRYSLGEDRLHVLFQSGLGLLALEELRAIAGALGAAGVPLVVLKGMAQALMFESGGPTRAMGDVDLLVTPEHYDAAAAQLVTLGFAPEPLNVSLPPRYEYERGYLKGRTRAELHRGFGSDPRQRVDHAGLLRRAVPAGPDCPGVLRLSPEDAFLHHCLHMAEHLFMQGVRPIWELRRLLRQDPPDLAVASRRAREWGTRRATWCALRLLELSFPDAVDETVRRHFELAGFVRGVLEWQVIRPAARNLVDRPFIPRVVRIWKWALLVDRPSDLVRYALWLPRYAWHRFWGSRRAGTRLAIPPGR